MKRVIIILLIVITICVGTVVAINIINKDEKKDEFSNLTVEEKIEKYLETMTIEEKIGQMLMIHYSGSEYDEVLANAINNAKPGGFILFSENIESYEQTYSLIKNIQDSSEIPVFISIDQEGGQVQRIKKLNDANVLTIPSMQRVGQMNNVELTKQVGKIIGQELFAFGVNMDFAPVLDINSVEGNPIGDRSFGNDSVLVSKMGIALAEGLQEENIIPVYKHFPGLGNVVMDTHEELAISNKTKDELLQTELIPYKEAIAKDAKMIMVGHIALPNITGTNTPASLSKEIVTDLLKTELGYNGLVITDALNMGALIDTYSKSEILIESVNAGVNILLMPGPSTEAVNTIKEAVMDGRIQVKKINDSVEKILRLKFESNIYDKNKKQDKTKIGLTENEQLLNTIK